MADLAQIGFRADTGELKDAKSAMEALAPAAGRAEKASERFGRTMDAAAAAGAALTAAAASLTRASDQLAARMSSQATATEKVASASTAAAGATGKISVTFNAVAAASASATMSFNKTSGAAKQVAVAANDAAAANDNMTGSIKRQGSALDAQRMKLLAVQTVMAGQFSGARDRGSDIAAYGAELDRLRAKYNPLFAVIQQYKKNVADIRQSNAVGALGIEEMNNALSRQRQAALTAIAGLKGIAIAGAGASAGLNAAGKSAKLRGDEMLNLSRQAADVGVTLAMGMNPLMVAIQQGPQIADVFASASQRGIGFSAVLRQIGASAAVALAPIVPYLIVIGLVLAPLIAAFGLGARQINKDYGDVAKTMGLTADQLEKVKKAGVSTTVTLGDTIGAFFSVLGERIVGAFAEPIKATKGFFTQLFDGITTDGNNAIKNNVSAFVGGYYAIVALWKNLPKTFSGISALIGNAFIKMFETIVNRFIDQVNGINDKVNQAAGMLGLDPIISKIDQVKFNLFDNKEAKATADAVGAAFTEGAAIGGKAYDRFMTDVQKRAIKDRKKLIKDAAGDAAKTPKGPKTASEKFQDIVSGANRDIATVKADIAGVNLTADAALRLKNEQKLLNEAQQKGIALTPAWRAQLVGLAGTLTDLQVKLKNMQGFKEITQGAQASLTAMLAERDAIGKVGLEAERARIATDLFAQAKAKDLAITPRAAAALNSMADSLARVAQANKNLAYYKDAIATGSENLDNIRAEAVALGMGAREAAAYLVQQKLLNDEKYRGIALGPQQRADIIANADAQFVAQQALDKTRERLAFTKDAARSFISDLKGSLDQGKSLFQSFGDAIGNVLNKILDRLLDKTLTAAFDNLFASMSGGAGGGGLFGSILGGLGIMGGENKQIGATSVLSRGGMAGTSHTSVGMFATGAAFTNSVVSKVTPFQAGKRGGLGVMGEAGPEAIVPLSRGPDGSLGVQMYGGTGGGGSSINAPVNINNYHTLTGAISSGDIVSLNRQAAEQTKEDVRKSLNGWLSQAQRDGAIV